MQYQVLVDVFDRRGVSFVSITQQFNTTTSMGRLTLNVLLSFAQFEREITGERIRDKIAASKKKGMWMGGMPPLGYDVKETASSSSTTPRLASLSRSTGAISRSHPPHPRRKASRHRAVARG
jgi:DNA invertase Pin-like site-specific DNA recombinase